MSEKISKKVSALGGAQFEGSIMVADAGLTGMITLRGDFKSTVLQQAIHSVFDVAIPTMRGITTSNKVTAVWMSPDELLLVLDYKQVSLALQALQKALAAEHALYLDVSDARTMFILRGDNLRNVLAKGTPANIAPEVFKVGQTCRTRLGQIAVAFWLIAANEARLVCFRSVSIYMFDWFKVAALKDYKAIFYS